MSDPVSSRVDYFKTIITIILFAISTLCIGQNLYVATTGSDNNVGIKTSPFKTITKGLSKIAIRDTLFIKEGVYQECTAYLSFGLGDKHVILRNGSSTISIVITGQDFKLCNTAPVVNDFTRVGITTQLITDPLIGIQFPDSCYYIPKTYYNTKVTSWAVKNDCPIGYTGNRVYYTVAAESYASEISQIDAQNKAKADAAKNKQAWANQKGTCTKIN